MTGPFSSVSPTGKPPWSEIEPTSGNFTQVNALGQGYQEIGYGEGGYGEDGYDTPSQAAQAAPTPDWVEGSSR